MITVALIGAVALASAQTENFYYCGAMDQLLAEGKAAAPIKTGLPANIIIKADGSMGPAEHELKGADWKGPAKLVFEDLACTDAKVTGKAKLTNSAGTSLQGLRLDLVATVETYKGKGPTGVDQVLTRAPETSFIPIFLGDLRDGESSDVVEFEITGVKVAPETVQIQLSFVLTGIRYLGGFSDPLDDLWAESMIFSPDGRLIIAGGQRQVIHSCTAEGKNFKILTPEDDHAPIRLAAAGNEMLVIGTNALFVRRFSYDGKELGRFPEKDHEGWVFNIRTDKAGAAYANASGTIYKYVNGKQTAILNPGEELLVNGYAPYDIDAAGLLWIATDEGLITMTQKGVKKEIAHRKDWRLGAFQTEEVNQALRIDPFGQIYVGESRGPTIQDAKITIFDGQGRFVRCFGRGGRKPATGDEPGNPGQILNPPKDFAFGKDGRVYVSHGNHEQGVLMYMPF